MIKPTVYKSISSADAKARTGVALDDTTKTNAFNILTRLTELIKAKHS